VEADKQYQATVSITSGDPDSNKTDVTQIIQLTATVTAAPKAAGEKPAEKVRAVVPEVAELVVRRRLWG